MASSTSDTIGSSNQAVNHGSDHARAPAAAKPWTFVIVNARPSGIPDQHNLST
jgi:hypothetical protein